MTQPEAAPAQPSLAPAPPAMPAALVVVVLSMLIGLQPITTDLYLPALPALTSGFGASMAQAQLTLTALLLAFGVSQLLWGSLSDRFGRRPVLLVGLFAYVVASVGSALAASMPMLIVWRALQGAAMGAGVMCARAILRDLYAPAEGARVMSKAQTGLGVIACLSAPLGGLLSDLFNWRIALAALAVFGATALGLIALRYQETLTQRNPHALRPATLLRTTSQVVRNPTFWAFSVLSGASYGGLFTFLASSSFVFIQVLGLSKTQYGLLMFSMSLAFITGTVLCRHLLARGGVRRAVAVAAFLTLSGGSALGVLALLGWHTHWLTIIVPFWLFMLGHGVHQPCGQSGAVGPFPQTAGAAAALNGFFMMLIAFCVGSWLGTRMDGTVAPLAYGVWFWSVIISGCAWTLVQKYGHSGGH